MTEKTLCSHILQTEEKADAYQPLLHAIATSLGLEERERIAMVEDVCSSVCKEQGKHAGDVPLRICLAKRLVQECVFTISSRVFSRASDCTFLSFNPHLPASALATVPFSFQVIYVLSRCIGFSEKELTQILNISQVQVRERLARAAMLIRHP